MINQLTGLILQKSVVGETHTIDTENIKVFEVLKMNRKVIMVNILDFCKDGFRRRCKENINLGIVIFVSIKSDTIH